MYARLSETYDAAELVPTQAKTQHPLRAAARLDHSCHLQMTAAPDFRELTREELAELIAAIAVAGVPLRSR